MINIELLKSSEYFKEKNLEKWEILFEEWDIDNNLYYILSWKLSIEKYTTSEKLISKQLAIIEEKDFFWEGALNNSEKKQVRILASQKAKLLYIDAKVDFLKFMKKNPQLAKNILVYIISLTNKRTLIWNKYITSIYEINKSITKIKNINFHEIFKIFDKINLVLEWKYLLFLEANPIDNTYLTLKYDSRKPWKMQDLLLKKWEYSLEEIWIKSWEKIITKEISIWWENLWNIILVKSTVFNENEKRIFSWMMNSIYGILKQKKIIEEEKNKAFSEN